MKNSLFIVLLILFGQDFISAQNAMPYKLTEENQCIVLPDELREVSGLTIIDSATLACIQDEEGIVFIYDLAKLAVIRKITFAAPGDYEGIAPVGEDLYVLRSDGVLFLIHDFIKNNPKIDSIETGIPNKNNEGLCYDKLNERLLIGSKSKIAKGPDFKNLRTIYAFDYRKKKLAESPLYTYDIRTIKKFAVANQIPLPTKENKKNPEKREIALKFQLSAIYIHPESQLLYVLSAADYYLFVFDPQGKILHLEVLDPQKFNKAEGIAIMQNGDLYISNEGQKGNPNILFFSEEQQN